MAASRSRAGQDQVRKTTKCQRNVGLVVKISKSEPLFECKRPLGGFGSHLWVRGQLSAIRRKPLHPQHKIQHHKSAEEHQQAWCKQVPQALPHCCFKRKKDDNKTILWSWLIFWLLEIISFSTRLTAHMNTHFDPRGLTSAKRSVQDSLKHLHSPRTTSGVLWAQPCGGSSVSYDSAVIKPPCQQTLQ